MRTYYVEMNITLSIDEQLVERARETLRAVGKSLNQEIREHLQHITGAGSVERVVERLAELPPLGNPDGWKWNREELYEDRIRWPR